MTNDRTAKNERGNVRANMSMSLDGFITGPNESIEQPFGDGGAVLHDWMVDGETEFSGEVNSSHDGHFNLTGNNHEVLREWFDTTGALVVGQRWFDGMEGWGGSHPIPGAPVFVLTHEPPEEMPIGETTFEVVTEGVERAVERASEAAGEGDVEVGGASVIQQCLDAGLLDEIRVHLVPVLLGDGVRLFENLGDGLIELERTRVVESTGVTHLRFDVVNRYGETENEDQ